MWKKSWLAALGLALGGVLLTEAPLEGGVLDASWAAPTVNTDGSPLTDLASYRVYYGQATAPCPGPVFFQVESPTPSPAPNTTVSSRLTGLTTGDLYYVAVTAVTTSGDESDCSVSASAVARIDLSGDTLSSPATDTGSGLDFRQSPMPSQPTVTITSPTSSSTYTTRDPVIALGGTAADDGGVTRVMWLNDVGPSGMAVGTTNWTATGIALRLGTNVITVVAENVAGYISTATLTVTLSGGFRSRRIR